MTKERDKELTDRKDAPRAERMRATLDAAFAPTTLEIEDESGRHEGHAGADPGGGTHYKVRMRAAAFQGLGRIARQRAVMAALAGEFTSGLHALALDLKAPDEG